jgi:hypothetical protein
LLPVVVRCDAALDHWGRRSNLPLLPWQGRQIATENWGAGDVRQGRRDTAPDDDSSSKEPRTMSDATHSEIERLKRLHRGARVALAGLERLNERTPEDDLRLRAQMRLTRRLADRIEWMEAQQGATPALVAAATCSRGGAAPDTVV